MFKVFVVLLAAYVIGNLINDIIGYIFAKKVKEILNDSFKESNTTKYKPFGYTNNISSRNDELENLEDRISDLEDKVTNILDMLTIQHDEQSRQGQLINELHCDNNDVFRKINDEINRLEDIVSKESEE